jgi:hypothetical protein
VRKILYRHWWGSSGSSGSLPCYLAAALSSGPILGLHSKIKKVFDLFRITRLIFTFSRYNLLNAPWYALRTRNRGLLQWQPFAKQRKLPASPSSPCVSGSKSSLTSTALLPLHNLTAALIRNRGIPPIASSHTVYITERKKNRNFSSIG